MTLTATDVVIQTGCNQGVGTFTNVDGRLVLAGMAFTARACPEEIVAAQDRGFRSLAGAPASMSAGGKELTLDPGGGGPVMVFARLSGG